MALHSTSFGGNAHRDDRRRRRLADDATSREGQAGNDGAWIPRVERPVHKSENYGDAEFLEHQLRLSHLIPRRLTLVALFLLLGGVAIGSLGGAYCWLSSKFAAPLPAMFDLTGQGTLATWLSSLMLLSASVAALIVYTIRRHRMDDYHGRYRVWIWAAVGGFLLATDAAAGLHTGWQQLMTTLCGTRIVGDGSIWWIVPAVFLYGAVGSRLLMDMWASRLGSTTFIASCLCYAAAITAGYGWIALSVPVRQVLLMHMLRMAGDLLLLLSISLKARHVLLDAEGALPRRTEKVKKRKSARPKLTIAKPEAEETAKGDDKAEVEENAETDQDEWVTATPPVGTSQPVLKRVPSAPPGGLPAGTAAKAEAHPEFKPVAGTTDDAKLNKSDRKALKKKLLEERLKREQRKAANW